jgi:hypothetical protein
VEWWDNYICSTCKVSRKVVKELEQGIDPDTKNPFRRIEMDCGHIEKTFRISKELTLRWQISKGDKVRVEPVITDGKPSVAVSGGSYSTIVPGAVNIGLEGAKNNTIFVNIIRSDGNTNFAQSISDTDINITYNEILKTIDRDISDDNERQEIKNILEEIKSDQKSKKIPDSSLEKQKKWKTIYKAVEP